MQDNIATTIPFHPANDLPIFSPLPAWPILPIFPVPQVQMINVYIFKNAISFRERHLVFYRLSIDSPFPQGCIIFDQSGYTINYSPYNSKSSIGKYFTECISKLYLDFGELDPTFTYTRLRQMPHFEDIRKQLTMPDTKDDFDDSSRFYGAIYNFPLDLAIFEKIFKYHNVSGKPYQRVNSLLSEIDTRKRDMLSLKIVSSAMFLNSFKLLGYHYIFTQNRPHGIREDYLKLVWRHNVFMNADKYIIADSKRKSLILT